MKRLKSMLATLAMLLCSFSASAHDFEVDGIYYNITDNVKSTVEVTFRGSSYDEYNDEYTGNVIIPEAVTYDSNNYAVTRIGDYAFNNCSSLTSITIPNSVTSIGDYAFGYCRSLTSVHISDIAAWCNIKFSTSGSNPLYYAKHLYMNGKEITELVIPDGVTSIGNNAFNGCSSLTSITIPDGVTSIGDNTFREFSSLTSVTIPEGVTSIGSFAFYECSSLTSVTIPNSVTSIGNYAFRECSSLTSVTIPNSVTSIGNDAFNGCASLTSITIPDGVTSIGDNTFSYCSSLTSVTIPEGVTSIGSSAFYYCRSLTSITIPDGVTSIGNHAFSGCTSLTSVTIPDGVTSIGNDAFYNCSSLTSITIPNSVTSIGRLAFDRTAWYNNQPDGVIYAGKVAYKYKGTMPSNTSIELAEGTLGIAAQAFSNCSSLTSITIPNSVTSIGSRAFEYCSSLTSITIPDGVTSIGDNTFSYCSSLTSVTIPNSVTSIGSEAFSYCASLTSITIPDGVTSIGNYTFYECSSLTSITIPNSVTSIGWYAFERTAWYNNQPDGVVYAGKVAYKYKGTMPSNTSIELAEGTLGITAQAFEYCSSLTSITIPDGVTSIGIDAFNGCSSLTSVTIPNSVTSIGYGAFSYCSSLTSVKVLAETPPVAYNTTFNNYDIELCVPEKSLEIYKATSPWSSFVNIIALAPPSTTSLTIGSTGSTTFSSIYNLDFSNVEGLKAYTATGYNSDNGELTLVRIKEAKAGTGLYVSGNAGTYTIPTISSTAYNSLNMFVGVNEETTISTTDGSYTNYIYTKPSGKEAGFYKVTTDRAIPAGKAYLQIPTAWLNEETASDAKAVKLVFDDGESTGIDEVNRVESKEEVIYDLQGRRVKNSSKGIYIINGKKVVR